MAVEYRSRTLEGILKDITVTMIRIHWDYGLRYDEDAKVIYN